MNHPTERPGVAQTLSFEDRMQLMCNDKGVTSMLFQPPGGNVWLYVSKDEPQILTAFLKAAIDTMTARGIVGNQGPVTIRRVEGGLIIPGKDVYWKVSDGENTIADGYAKDEETARVCVREAMLAGLKM